MPFANYVITKGGQLTIGQIESPNFSLAGQTGWAILKNGNAYFFNLTAEGNVTATQFLGTDFVINTSGAFFYSGTPANGNLIASIATASGTDSFGNAYSAGVASYNGGITVNLTNGTVTFTPITAGHLPGEISSFTGTLFANSPAETGTDVQSQWNLLSKTAALAATLSGSFQVNDGVDGNTYNTQILTKHLTSNTGTLTGLANVIQAAVGIRSYRVHGQLFVAATSGAEFTCAFALPGSVGSGQFSYVICRATTFVAEVAGGPNSSVGAAVSLSTATYSVTIEGFITVAAAGTMSFQVGSLTATGLIVNAFSFIDLIPV